MHNTVFVYNVNDNFIILIIYTYNIVLVAKQIVLISFSLVGS